MNLTGAASLFWKHLECVHTNNDIGIGNVENIAKKYKIPIDKCFFRRYNICAKQSSRFFRTHLADFVSVRLISVREVGSGRLFMSAGALCFRSLFILTGGV